MNLSLLRTQHPLISYFLGALFPPACRSCGKNIDKISKFNLNNKSLNLLEILRDNLFCRVCLNELLDDKIKYEEEKHCFCCGRSIIENKLSPLCINCIDNRVYKNLRIRSLFYYQKIPRFIIHLMKYKQDTVTASLLSLLIKNELNSFFQAGSVYYNKDILGPAIGWDTISYIPSIKEHYLKRGFYSTHYIARNLATQLNIPFLKIKFEKKLKKNTKPISIKSRKNKEDKPKFIATLSTTNKICVNKSEIKSILIIDDVITTGASLESIIKSLSKYNLEKIDIISIAQSKRLHRYLFK